MRVVTPENHCPIRFAHEHLEQLEQSIEQYRSAQSAFIACVLDAKLSKKDSDIIRQALSKIEPSYWRIEHELHCAKGHLQSLESARIEEMEF